MSLDASAPPANLPVTNTPEPKRRHRPRPDRIDLGDGEDAIPDADWLRQYLANASYRTGKRADDDGCPFLMVNGLKYRPRQRCQEWLRERIRVLGQAPKRRKRGR